jgi:hypothetical protein
MALVTTASTHVKDVTAWSNFHTTIEPRRVPFYCTTLSSDMRVHGASIVEVLRYCFDNQKRMRAMGARWSLSQIGAPEDVMLDTANMEHVHPISDDWVTSDYRSTRRAGYVPMLVQGGATVASINRRFAQQGLALQTSGAADGHRIAGCVATGTHGANVKVGAVHDTLLAMHIVVAPDKALFIQPSKKVVSDAVAHWLGASVGIPTESVADDETFQAAMVSLGSLGFVHAVVIEAAPLYYLRRVITHTKWENPDVWDALVHLKAKGIPDPIHVQVLFNPYPDPLDVSPFPTAYTNIMEKVPIPPHLETVPPTTTAAPVINSDLMGIIGHLLSTFRPSLGTFIVRPIVRGMIERIYPEGTVEHYPGNMFGPTTLASGPGASSEIFVDHKSIERVVELFQRTLRDQASDKGWHLAGAIGVRVMKGTNALLGMNQWPLSCALELPSIRTTFVSQLYKSLYSALERQGIPYVCHWGQEHQMTAANVRAVYGSKADAWCGVRKRVLDAKGQFVFGSAHLESLGLV